MAEWEIGHCQLHSVLFVHFSVINWHSRSVAKSAYYEPQAVMAWLCSKHAQQQDTHEMDSNWEGEKARSKNYLVKNSDERAGGDGSNMGWITGQSSEQDWVSKLDQGLMSQ